MGLAAAGLIRPLVVRVLFVLAVWAWLLWAMWSYGPEPGPF